MEIRLEGDFVSVEMTRDEAARLGIALRAGYESTSRSEYYIRTGLSQSVVREIAGALIATDEAVRIEPCSWRRGYREPTPPKATGVTRIRAVVGVVAAMLVGLLGLAQSLPAVASAPSTSVVVYGHHVYHHRR